jgi:glycosyltransferase involved in cell wall biosynthesis
MMTGTANRLQPEERLITLDVVIPVLNEVRELERSVERVREFLAERLPNCVWRMVIADNGSTDGTADAGRRLAAAHPDVALIHLGQRGRGGALRRAWLESTAEIVCYMDVDLSTELDALPRAVCALIEQGHDVAVGSRLLPESKVQRSLRREVISRAYNRLVKMLLRTRFSDAQCGFKVLTRQAVEDIVPRIQDRSWFFDTELLVLAEQLGYRIQDLPVVWNDDADSRVKILRTAWDDIKGIFRLRKLLRSEEFRALAEERRAWLGARGAAPAGRRRPQAIAAVGPVLQESDLQETPVQRKLASAGN